MHRVTQDQMLAAVEAIHAAGLDAQRWPDALAAVTTVIGGVGTALEVIDRRTLAHCEFRSFGLPPAGQLQYLEHYAPLNPRFRPALRQRPGDMALDYQVIDERGMDSSPFYVEFLAPLDLRYQIGGILDVPKQELGVISVQRSAKHGHGGRAEMALLARLLPHVSQALDVTRRLARAELVNRSLQSIFDWLSDGVLLIAANGNVMYANDAMRAIARCGDGIAISKGMLAFTRSSDGSQLDGAMGTMRRLRDGGLDAPMIADFPVVRPSGAPAYLVSIRPLSRAARADGLDAGAVAVMFVRDPTRHNAAAMRLLHELFGLTEAEVALAQALQAGIAPADYARARAVSLNTVYTHLRRIKEKTGCRRMGELIRRLNDLQGPLRLD